MDLSNSERFLLDWLDEAEFGQYGECHGRDLDSLIAKGLAKVHSAHEHQSTFIAKGDGIMYRAVSLTNAGRAARKSEEAQ